MKRDVEIFSSLGYQVYFFPATILNRGGLLVLYKEKLQDVAFQKYEQRGKFYTEQLSDRLSGKGFFSAQMTGGLTITNKRLVCPCNQSADADVALQSQLNQLLEYTTSLDECRSSSSAESRYIEPEFVYEGLLTTDHRGIYAQIRIEMQV